MPTLAGPLRAGILVLAGLVLAGVASCTRLGRSADVVFARDPDVLYGVETDASALALTLDDGPDPETTPALLRLLAEHGARATFFLIADRVEGREEILDAIVAGGHEIGNHGLHDVPSIDLAPEVFEQQLLEAHRKLSPWATPQWFRPGSGWYEPWMLEVLARHGYRCVLGSSHPFDAQLPWVWLALRWLSIDAEPGEVIVLHDGGERGLRTVQVLESLLPELARRGLRVVTLSELVALGDSPVHGATARPSAAVAVGPGEGLSWASPFLERRTP